MLTIAALVAAPSGAHAALINTEEIIGTPAQFNGNTKSVSGFTLTAMLDGLAGSQLAYDGGANPNNGLGVGQPAADGPSVGFTRSINNNGANAESIKLDLPATGFGGLTAITVASAGASAGGLASTIVISGFTADPSAAGAGSIGFAAGAITWIPGAGGLQTLTLGNQAATPAGSSLEFSNGATDGGNNQYGLRSFEYNVPVPEPSAILLLLAGSAVAGLLRRHGRR
ncbi:PEP-CTERM sorting domain-containing protein [Pirellulimonas nuda]|nr:PEP-CTERM sorting domain-containing protein [Pirellulimonas nuda]